MSKDRARPFSRKHRRYWIPVTGGMILIGIINVAIGYCTYDPPTEPPQKQDLGALPRSEFAKDAGAADLPDAATK